MARKRCRIREEGENPDRWIVSYADFVTLLFAFFLVMYSISSVNEGKYRVLSESLDEAFSEKVRSKEPIQLGEVPRSDIPKGDLIVGTMDIIQERIPDELAELDDIARLVRVSNQLEEVLSPYINQDLIEITRDDLWIEVAMKSGMLFQSGRADLADEALPLLAELAATLRPIPNSIQVEGHTDNLAIETIEFPSNWELSAARAASVVHQLSVDGVKPVRLAAIGYGEHQPIADNRFEEGRNKNRRVILVLLSQRATRHRLSADDRASSVAFGAKPTIEKKAGRLPL